VIHGSGIRPLIGRALPRHRFPSLVLVSAFGRWMARFFCNTCSFLRVTSTHTHTLLGPHFLWERFLHNHSSTHPPPPILMINDQLIMTAYSHIFRFLPILPPIIHGTTCTPLHPLVLPFILQHPSLYYQLLHSFKISRNTVTHYFILFFLFGLDGSVLSLGHVLFSCSFYAYSSICLSICQWKVIFMDFVD